MDDCCERMPSKPQRANNYIVKKTIKKQYLFRLQPYYTAIRSLFFIFSNFFMLFFRFPTKFFLSS